MKGQEKIKLALSDMPTSPGVYQMIDKGERIIYIGKAKNLKKRLANYTKYDLPNRTLMMVSLVESIKIITTSSEAEAFLLEASMIHKIQPKYNILLKDDKSFPYIKIRTDHDFGQVIKYRGKDVKQSNLFGPYASIQDVNLVIEELNKVFKLRTCSDNYIKNRKRPCLQYQIKKCSAPCTGKISLIDYQKDVNNVIKFLQGKNSELQNDLADEMQKLSMNMEYEKAAAIRDKIKALSYIQSKAFTSNYGLINADVIAIVASNYEYCIEILLFRGGRACGNKSYFPRNTEESEIENVLSSFIGQFYQTRPIPEEIILSHHLQEKQELSKALSKFSGHDVKISSNKQIHSSLISMLINNANISLKNKQKDLAKNQQILLEIKEMFDLPQKPTRIEVYDNSHISGTNAIGAMVVVTEEGFDKKEYRTFNIKTNMPSTGGDDYAMLKEVMTRRLKKLSDDNYPSLMIIDGGKGHFNVVESVMQELGVHIPFVCMAKGKDRNAGKEMFHYKDKEAFTIDSRSGLMKYLQIIRDEVHNFAIDRHRKKRSRSLKISELDNIESIGTERRKMLLNYFGSIEGIKNATIEEISQVRNISENIAKKIYDYFHS